MTKQISNKTVTDQEKCFMIFMTDAKKECRLYKMGQNTIT